MRGSLRGLLALLVRTVCTQADSERTSLVHTPRPCPGQVPTLLADGQKGFVNIGGPHCIRECPKTVRDAPHARRS
eukprot:4799636-Pleurochrysis_carterae.AAC.4